MGRDRNQQGRYADRIPPEDVLEVFDDRDDLARPITAGDVTEALGIARRTAHNKLHELVERGALETRKVGARGRVWWVPLPREGDVPLSGVDTAPRARETGPDARDGPEAPTPETPRETASTPRQDAESHGLEAVDFPQGRDREACVNAVLAARDHLREDGPATMRELVASIMPEHPLGYTVDEYLEKVEAGDRIRGGWWRNVIKPGLEALEDVTAPARGASDWRYTGFDGGSETR